MRGEDEVSLRGNNRICARPIGDREREANERRVGLGRTVRERNYPKQSTVIFMNENVIKKPINFYVILKIKKIDKVKKIPLESTD